MVTSAPKPIKENSNITIYPNPVQKGNNFTLKLDNNYDSAEISIYDKSGKKLYYNRTYNNQDNIPAPVNEGIYIVSVRTGYIEKTLKIIVN